MSTQIGNITSWTGGISGSKKTGKPHSFSFGRSINFRSESSQITVLPKTTKISGSTVTDLPMWGEVACVGSLYFHGNTGNIYKINESDVVSKEYTVPDSQGNGLAYLPEDKYLYIPTNKSITRRSNACDTGEYFDTFLESSGGEPTNTKSITFASASSQSATRADTASLSITGDITLETYVKPTTMPTSGNQMAIMGKWDESGTLQSYKLSFVPVSNFFGNGTDGALTISGNTTDAPIDSACTGTAGTNTLSATNASFAAGQKVLIHQTQGTGAGTREIGEISSYTAGTITLAEELTATYTSGAQVLVLKQYSSVTVNSGVTWTAKAWNGTVGGILAFLCSGAIAINGTVTASAKGFRGASAVSSVNSAKQGEGTSGPAGTTGTAANGNGGGGGSANAVASSGGGGGGNGASGPTGGTGGGLAPGSGGSSSGSADLTTATFGGGGGGGGAGQAGGSGSGTGGGGGIGGGYLFMAGTSITVHASTGTVVSAGENGGNGSGTGNASGGGAGAGGSIDLFTQTGTLNTTRITAPGGSGGAKSSTGAHASAAAGGAGAAGRIHIAYATSYTGTTTPTIYAEQDAELSNADGYALRFYVSSNGTNSETYTQPIDDPTGYWNRFSVAWDASASTAYFYKNGAPLGTKVGAFTGIHDNASAFQLACYENSGGSLTGFYNGQMDDARVWNTLRTDSEIATYSNRVLSGVETGLVAYYEFEGGVTDSQTSGNNDLTANNTPTYSTDVPFSGVSTRGDEDVSISASGQTYTLSTALSEGATHRQTFVPTKEPIKSIALNIDTVGSGNWTVVIHDELNREAASLTVSNANLHTGIYEFIFSSSFRPVLNANYHLHVYDTTGDGAVVTGTLNDLETAYLKTYFQILVEDQYHPAKQFLNFLVIGNERYLAKLDAGSIYNPHRLIFPSGYRVRCLAYWRDYIVIGTVRGDAVTDTDEGKIFFWDGTSDTYAEPLDVPQGAINAIHGVQGKLRIAAGYRGKVLEYTGGEEARQIFKTPELADSDYIEIAPGAMTMYNNLLHMGSNLSTNSTTAHQGIYTWGKLDSEDADALGFDYPLSIGDQTSSNVKVGSLVPRGRKLYAGFQNGATYGIDVVDPSAQPYPTATLELLNADLGSIGGSMLPLVFKAEFLPLEADQSISIKYKPDRSTSWNTLTTQSNTGATEARATISRRVREVQFAVDITSSTTSPTIIGQTLEIDNEQHSRQA